MNEYRTHNCGELTKADIGKRVKLAGWIQTSRNLGGLLFIDLRDQYGLTQAVVTIESGLIEEVSKIPTESTVSIEGEVRLRQDLNPNMKTGEIEIIADKVEVLGKRLKELPFEINTDKNIL